MMWLILITGMLLISSTYQISLKENLTGSFIYGRSQYDFSEGTMIFTQPGQTIQMNENESVENAKGYILLFIQI